MEGREQIARLIEALLFVAEEPVQRADLARALEVEEAAVAAALDDLQAFYSDRGLRLQREAGAYQLVTAPEAAEAIEAFLGLDLSTKLSQAATETVAIIAYRQPVTKAELSDIRGVDCGGVLRTLQARGLVEEVGRLDQAGRPILYGTTFQFLRYFGIEDLEALPPLPHALEGARPKAEED
jgi:segregation and condensation protein B